MSQQQLGFHALQTEFARIDVLIHRRLSAMARVTHRGDTVNALNSGVFVTPERIFELLEHSFGQLTVNRAGEESSGSDAIAYPEILAGLEEQRAALNAASEEQGGYLKLNWLAGVFGLSAFELDAFLVCLAPSLDLRYERIYGFLQDDMTRRRASVSLLLDLLCEPGIQRLSFLRYFADDAPLIRHKLLKPAPDNGGADTGLLAQQYTVDSSVVTWLFDGYHPNGGTRTFLEFSADLQEEDAFLSDQQNATLRQAAQESCIVAMTGRDELAQEEAARSFAARQGLPLLTLNLAEAIKAGVSAFDAVKLCLRDALLLGAVAHVSHWDACLEESAPSPDVMAAVLEQSGPVVISGEANWRPRQIQHTRPLYWVDFPMPVFAQRLQLLQRYLGALVAAHDLDIEGLAGRFVLMRGQLRDVVATALGRAQQAGRPINSDDLFLAGRDHSNPRLITLARKLTPRYDWSDLILPSDQVTKLRELVDAVRSRPQVLEGWAVGRKLAASAGISALFAGPPGTGKTMAAEVIARVLQLDLYKIDLSNMISKYIGETEKNLERIFTEAESSNAILFFDEADAIFGKRSEVKDAHDRYANIEVSYLLQRMEAYDGVTILATNLRANLDEAFTRRLHTVVDFPAPDLPERLRIWQTLFPASVPRADDVDFAILAQRFKFSGGNIRNIIVTAAHLAAADGQVVTMAHLMHSARREMQKLGRLTDDKDFGPRAESANARNSARPRS